MFIKQTTATIKGTVLNKGDLVKIDGLNGKFKFNCVVRNPDSGQEWVDVYELEGGCRSFEIDRIKIIRGKRTRTRT